MRINQVWSLKNLPRERLEELALRALAELCRMRELENHSRIFGELFVGLLAGAILATTGFLIGAAIR